MSYDVAWNRRKRLEWRNAENAPWIIECFLLKRVLIDGRLQLKVAARIAAIHEDRTDDPAARELFWADATRKLGRMHRLNGDDIVQIEALIAKKVAKPKPVSAPHGGA